MKNRELYFRDPTTLELLNNGVAVVKDAVTPEELKTLRFELKTFVCEGEYAKGLEKICGVVKIVDDIFADARYSDVTQMVKFVTVNQGGGEYGPDRRTGGRHALYRRWH